MGRYAEAAELHQQTLTDLTRILGPEHPDTLTSRSNLAAALASRRPWPRWRSARVVIFLGGVLLAVVAAAAYALR